MSTSLDFASTWSAFDFSSATSLLDSRNSSSSSSVFFHLDSASCDSVCNRLFSFSSSSIRNTCFRYMSCTSSPGLRGRPGDFSAEGEPMAAADEPFRKESDRIFDCTDMEG